MPCLLNDDRCGPQLPRLFSLFLARKGYKKTSTESVTLDRYVGDCYITGANQMMRALRGNLGGLFSFWSSPFSSARVFGCDRGSAPRAALILPLFKKLSQRGFRALFEPLAEFRVVLAGDLDSDRLAID